MKRAAMLLFLTLTACANYSAPWHYRWYDVFHLQAPIQNDPVASTRSTAKAAPIKQPTPACVRPPPPTKADLDAEQAIHGLIGRDNMLTDYAKRAHNCK